MNLPRKLDEQQQNTHKTTQVQHDYNTQLHKTTRVKHDVYFDLYHRCTLGTLYIWLLKLKIAFSSKNQNRTDKFHNSGLLQLCFCLCVY